MRLLRISLVAIVATTIFSGCSASRYRISFFRDRDDSASALQDEHEYSPSPDRASDDEFRNPPGEPVPAPPAMGISRVKSVSFLKDLGGKLHGRKDDCVEDCVDDSELVGKCSPVEPCVPSAEQNQRVHRYVDRYNKDDNTDRLNPLRSFKKSIKRTFHHEPAQACAPECAEVLPEPGCNAPARTCDQSPRVLRKHTESCGTACAPEPRPPAVRQKRSAECLADPMEENDLPVPQGLITPKDHIKVQEVPALPFPGEEQNLSPETAPPAVPALPPAASIPQSAPTPEPQKSPAPVPQVEDLPLPPGTTQTVEPPAWPRLQGTNKQVSLPSGTGTRRAAGPMIIQPRPSR